MKSIYLLLLVYKLVMEATGNSDQEDVQRVLDMYSMPRDLLPLEPDWKTYKGRRPVKRICYLFDKKYVKIWSYLST